MPVLALLLATASAWDERGPEGAPTGRVVSAAARFGPRQPDWARSFVATPSSELGSVARETARELREQRAAGTLLATSGLFEELGIDLDRVLDTLDLVATVADEDRGQVSKRLEDPAWLARSFDLLGWRSDTEAARARGVALAPDEVRLTKYVVWQVQGSHERTDTYDTALYAPPDDALRMRFTRPEVYAGAYDEGGAAAGQARPLVWLTRDGVNEALLQGSVEVELPDGVRMFNVLLNNGIPYDPRQKDHDLQRRYWYFHEVRGVLGVEQIPLRPRAAVAGDVWNLGLGKIVALEWQGPHGPELHLTVLADTGGAFQPNLFQLDWLAGTFPSRAAFETFERTTPSRVRASVLVRKRPSRRPLLALCAAPLGVVLLVWAVLTSGPSGLRRAKVEPVAGRRTVPTMPFGSLSGLVVYVSAGHGWLLHRVRHDGDPIAWGRQRDHRFGMVEDDWTAQFVADALAPALEAEGATVIALRERDRNAVDRVVDDQDPAFAAFGVDERRARADAEAGADVALVPGGSATWSLEVPDDGQWYAYARWTDGPEQDERAVYTIVAGDQVREVVVDQRHHGGHWWPLGDFCLPAGARVEVTLTGSGRTPLSADAVRIGGGTFGIVLPWSYALEQQPYWSVAMPHQIERLGGPGDFDAYTCGNAVSDMRLRPHWATWASAHDDDAVYLSIHTNASPVGRAQGLTVFYGVDHNPPTAAEPESVRLSALLERGIHESVTRRDPLYRTRGVQPGNFSEVSPVHNRLPASLLEMGFHTDAADAKRMQTRQFQHDAAAGVVDGLVAWRAGVPAGLDLPLSPPRWSGSGPWMLLE